ncbi:MAG: FxsA family protein [Propionibacterium sp.]|nr:FxsA family protein [Propionibacterium sp.]
MANGRIRFRGTLGLLLVLVPFLVYLAAEVSVMLLVIDTLGWWTVPVLILTTLFGCWMLQREGRRTWSALIESLSRGALPPGRTADAVLVMIGGFLLIMPGFVSDVIGLMLLIPPSRRLIRSTLGKLFGRAIGDSSERPIVIEGEVVQDSPASPETMIPEISPPSP